MYQNDPTLDKAAAIHKNIHKERKQQLFILCIAMHR